MGPVDTFIKFEQAADAAARELVQGKPLRSVMTLLHLGSYALSQCWGDVIEPAERVRGGGGVERLGYLLPLVKYADTEFKGASSFDSLFAFGEKDEQIRALNLLYGYAEFCQVAPFAHRGAYRVEGDSDTVKFAFRSASFADAEVKDILMSTLFQPNTVHDGDFARDWFDVQAPRLPTVDLAGNYVIQQKLTEWFIDHTYEVSPLSDAAMRASVEVGSRTFRKFAAACMALGQYHMSMADAISRRIEQDPAYGASEEAFAEQLEWISPCYAGEFVRNQIAWLARLERADVDRLMQVYSTSGGSQEKRGEGFFPPFVQSGNTCTFSPLTIRHMLSSRNVLYSLAKDNKERFDDVISAHLEPQLVEQAVNHLRRLRDVEIRRNVQWEQGEIDILVYRKSENVALVVEAKGAVAPDGARMVYHVQSRIKDGINQLRKFDALSPDERDGILGRALGRQVRDVRCVKAVLAWASFGTEEVWEQFTDIAPLNIALLAELVRRDLTRELDRLVNDTHALIDEIVISAEGHWKPTERTIGSLTFERPSFKFNEDALAKYRTAQHL
ncbi:hypothetical protein [Burkholderia ubonensis]|uniref:hypothetical protein n=1 Tax=Burkholderia ubonensis TaxID=101571 RepID=UPI00075296AB|nr:hypothetical protein [Burkholderia ubonensis]KVG72274.1 hypothetical protein WJ34_19620 [Burkholderia ubonensis]KVH17994.1 hypothetical protein WJ37_24120 [Burkholderia ubonensis]KVH41338.1 hypothetical protein WJ38_30575 [Burkholderia ubonensis]KVH85443.1 hypothetical protein WJ43_11125 [Burkholderia ubonensis]KVM33687.1 hypothetical protein WJ55_14870 [Burkholderia ubonensis]